MSTPVFLYLKPASLSSRFVRFLSCSRAIWTQDFWEPGFARKMISRHKANALLLEHPSVHWILISPPECFHSCGKPRRPLRDHSTGLRPWMILPNTTATASRPSIRGAAGLNLADLQDLTCSAASRKRSATGEQVPQQHNHCNYKQCVDEASANVKAKAQQPHDIRIMKMVQSMLILPPNTRLLADPGWKLEAHFLYPGGNSCVGPVLLTCLVTIAHPS